MERSPYIWGMKKDYNYKKIFFRRPLWTDDNRRFWSILVLSTLIIILLCWNSLNWASHVSTTKIIKKVERNYIAFLSKAGWQRPARLELSESSATKKDEGEVKAQIQPDRVLQKELLFKNKSAKARYRSSIRQRRAKKGSGFDARPNLAADERLLMAPITAAVSAVPGFAGLPVGEMRVERDLELTNGKDVASQSENPIQIPQPELFQHPSRNGNRDLWETTAVLDANEVDIRYCFERYSRFDPTFKGDIVVSFTIHPDGHVIPSSIKIIQSNITDPRIIRCIKKSIQRWRNFPRIALENGNFTITRKYIF